MLYRPAMRGFSILLMSLISASAVAQVTPSITGAASPATQPTPARPVIVPMTVEGIVLNQEYKPIPNAKIWFVQSTATTEGKTVETTSDSNGRFKADGDSSMRMVVARAAGYGIGGEQVASPLTATAGVKPTVIVLAPAANVRVRVVDPDGKPASGVVVNFGGDGVTRTRSLSRSGYLNFVPKELESHFTQTTDASGLCVFQDWPQDFSTAINVADDRYAQVSNSELVTIQRSASTDYTLRLDKASSITGTVTIQETKAPAAGIQLQLVVSEQSGLNTRADTRSAVTDADGKFSFKRLSAGEYDLVGSIPSALASKYAPPSMSGIHLPKGIDYDGVSLFLSAGSTISGRVTSRDGGAPIPNIRVAIRDLQPRFSISQFVVTGEDGSYSIHTTPGDRVVSVQPISSGRTAPTTQFAAVSRQVTVTAAPMAPIDFQLTAVTATPARGVVTTADGRVIAGTVATTRGARGATAAVASSSSPVKVKGIVVDSDGKPVPYAMLDIEAPVDLESDTFTTGMSRFGDGSMRADAEGKFELPAVVAGSLLHARTLTLATGKGSPLPGNDQEARLIVRKEAVGSARVKTVDVDGKPLKDVALALIVSVGSGGGISFGQDARSTAEDGTWTFMSLSSDFSYSVQASAKGFGRQSARLELQPGGATEQILTLKRTDSFLAGMVMDESGNPLPNARIRVTASSSGTQGYFKTDEAGNFRIENLVKDEPVSVYLMDGTRTAGTQRGVAGKDELIVLQRQIAPTPVGARRGGRAGTP